MLRSRYYEAPSWWPYAAIIAPSGSCSQHPIMMSSTATALSGAIYFAKVAMPTQDRPPAAAGATGERSRRYKVRFRLCVGLKVHHGETAQAPQGKSQTPPMPVWSEDALRGAAIGALPTALPPAQLACGRGAPPPKRSKPLAGRHGALVRHSGIR
jgi:hypothetical protein